MELQRENQRNLDHERRDQVTWIVQQVNGRNVLDIGCANGERSICLGREGKSVLGIDFSTEAIKQAQRNLEMEEAETRVLVTFKRGNLFLDEFTSMYDTVVLDGILQNIADMDTFLNKTISLVEKNGRIIVTVPFGIRNNTKRTFYLLELLKLQNYSLVIEELKFFGSWTGIIYRKSDKPKFEITESIVNQFEKAVLKQENVHDCEIEKLQQIIDSSKEKIEELEGKLKKQDMIYEKMEHAQQQFLTEKALKVTIQKELFDAYSENEATINKYRKLHRDYETLLGKYHNLKNSKLGKLTTKYWQLRRKKRGNKK